LNLAGRGLLSKQLNVPGITKIDGLSATAEYFNENMPLRDGVPFTVGLTDGTTQVIQSPVTNTVAGAMAIQQLLDNWNWVAQPSEPVAWAPYLRKDPLPGVSAKPVIIQFDKGDQNISNPTETAFLRAGDLADRTTYYRYDLAFAESKKYSLPLPPASLSYPHTFLGLIINPNNLIVQEVARGAEQQIATFFATDGTETIQPPGVINLPDGTQVPVAQFFEVPIQGPLPEGLNYIV
jgi:hypothetical protein